MGISILYNTSFISGLAPSHKAETAAKLARGRSLDVPS